MLKMRSILHLVMFVIPMMAWSHGGGLDDHGGHKQRSTGEYHCHQEPCLSQHREVKQSTQDALIEKRTFTALYNRSDWPHWSDFDSDCQDTRAEVLIKNSQEPVQFRRGGVCTVDAGEWVDPYTGKLWTLASDLDADHIVPLKWAHQHGGALWSKDQKERFANDFENLLAVEDNLNQSKGAKGPGKWMPPLAGYHCQYLESWEHILTRYGLVYSAQELIAIQGKYAHCFN